MIDVEIVYVVEANNYVGRICKITKKTLWFKPKVTYEATVILYEDNKLLPERVVIDDAHATYVEAHDAVWEHINRFLHSPEYNTSLSHHVSLMDQLHHWADDGGALKPATD